jgi:hypothetical protein
MCEASAVTASALRCRGSSRFSAVTMTTSSALGRSISGSGSSPACVTCDSRLSGFGIGNCAFIAPSVNSGSRRMLMVRSLITSKVSPVPFRSLPSASATRRRPFTACVRIPCTALKSNRICSRA